MDSTLLESREMRAGVGQQAPISSRLYNTRQRVRHGGLKSPRNPERSGSIRQYDSHIRMMGFVRRPTGNGLVVGVYPDAPVAGLKPDMRVESPVN